MRIFFILVTFAAGFAGSLEARPPRFFYNQPVYQPQYFQNGQYQNGYYQNGVFYYYPTQTVQPTVPVKPVEPEVKKMDVSSQETLTNLKEWARLTKAKAELLMDQVELPEKTIGDIAIAMAHADQAMEQTRIGLKEKNEALKLFYADKAARSSVEMALSMERAFKKSPQPKEGPAKFLYGMIATLKVYKDGLPATDKDE